MFPAVNKTLCYLDMARPGFGPAQGGHMEQ